MYSKAMRDALLMLLILANETVMYIPISTTSIGTLDASNSQALYRTAHVCLDPLFIHIIILSG